MRYFIKIGEQKHIIDIYFRHADYVMPESSSAASDFNPADDYLIVYIPPEVYRFYQSQLASNPVRKQQFEALFQLQGNDIDQCYVGYYVNPIDILRNLELLKTFLALGKLEPNETDYQDYTHEKLNVDLRTYTSELLDHAFANYSHLPQTTDDATASRSWLNPTLWFIGSALLVLLMLYTGGAALGAVFAFGFGSKLLVGIAVCWGLAALGTSIKGICNTIKCCCTPEAQSYEEMSGLATREDFQNDEPENGGDMPMSRLFEDASPAPTNNASAASGPESYSIAPTESLRTRRLSVVPLRPSMPSMREHLTELQAAQARYAARTTTPTL